MGKYQRATMWAVGVLLGVGFLADAIDYFVFENPSSIDVPTELGWTSLFLLTVAAIEGMLWCAFRTYNDKKTKS
jgi:uncharacterized membrane protein YpjA